MEQLLSTPMPPAGHGGAQASEALFGALYRELRGVARRELARSGPGASLGATSLLHEAYLGIAQREGMAFPDRTSNTAVLPIRVTGSKETTSLSVAESGQPGHWSALAPVNTYPSGAVNST